MKTKMRGLSYILMFTLLNTTLHAQGQSKEQDQTVKQNNINLQTLNTAYYPRTISWWDSGNGFICKVSVAHENYLTRFDKQGKYVETLTKKDWNDAATLQPAFQQSQYKFQTVTAYWVVSDANKKGYYLELNDSQNRSSSVWVDDQGTFSIIPTTKAKQ